MVAGATWLAAHLLFGMPYPRCALHARCPTHNEGGGGIVEYESRDEDLHQRPKGEVAHPGGPALLIPARVNHRQQTNPGLAASWPWVQEENAGQLLPAVVTPLAPTKIAGPSAATGRWDRPLPMASADAPKPQPTRPVCDSSSEWHPWGWPSTGSGGGRSPVQDFGAVEHEGAAEEEQPVARKQAVPDAAHCLRGDQLPQRGLPAGRRQPVIDVCSKHRSSAAEAEPAAAMWPVAQAAAATAAAAAQAPSAHRPCPHQLTVPQPHAGADVPVGRERGQGWIELHAADAAVDEPVPPRPPVFAAPVVAQAAENDRRFGYRPSKIVPAGKRWHQRASRLGKPAGRWAPGKGGPQR